MMLRINLIVFILSFTTFIGATSVKANCLMFGENERLSNYCLLESIKGKLVDQTTANIVVQKLMQEGYLGGLKTPATTFNVYPDIAYSNNINGGNPDKPLIVGNLEFEGEPDLVAKEGGSRKTHAMRIERLRHAGLSAADCAQIQGPIGLVPSLRNASLIAVSALAEITAKLPPSQVRSSSS